jgi:cytochrome d ubiquinol oxidase subunit II
MLLSAAFGLYPLVLPASDHVDNLTIYNASASQYGQTVGLIWWILGMILAVIYFIFAYRLFWGKVQVKETEGY